MPGFTKEEIVNDRSETHRLLNNAQIVLWDIDRDELTPREKRRLKTINNKIDELEEIIKEREMEEWEREKQ